MSHDSGLGSKDKNDSFDFNSWLDNFQSKSQVSSCNLADQLQEDGEDDREPKVVPNTHLDVDENPPHSTALLDAVEEVDFEIHKTAVLRTTTQN